jgi:hypothetical protein
MDNFFANIVILPMLSYFQLLYGYFSLIILFHPTLVTYIYGYFQLLLAIFGCFILCYFSLF